MAPMSGFRSGRPKPRPPSRIAANSAWTMVGFILMKVSSCSHSVSPPNTATTAAVTSGIRGTRRSIAQAAPSAAMLATTTTAVAAIRPYSR